MPKDMTPAECHVNPSCELFDGFVAVAVEELSGPGFDSEVIEDMARFAVRKRCARADNEYRETFETVGRTLKEAVIINEGMANA